MCVQVRSLERELVEHQAYKQAAAKSKQSSVSRLLSCQPTHPPCLHSLCLLSPQEWFEKLEFLQFEVSKILKSIKKNTAKSRVLILITSSSSIERWTDLLFIWAQCSPEPVWNTLVPYQLDLFPLPRSVRWQHPAWEMTICWVMYVEEGAHHYHRENTRLSPQDHLTKNVLLCWFGKIGPDQADRYWDVMVFVIVHIIVSLNYYLLWF